MPVAGSKYGSTPASRRSVISSQCWRVKPVYGLCDQSSGVLSGAGMARGFAPLGCDSGVDGPGAATPATSGGARTEQSSAIGRIRFIRTGALGGLESIGSDQRPRDAVVSRASASITQRKPIMPERSRLGAIRRYFECWSLRGEFGKYQDRKSVV